MGKNKIEKSNLKFPKNLFTKSEVLKFRKKELHSDMPWRLITTKSDYVLILRF